MEKERSRQVETVCHFNRFYTKQIGVLHERLLLDISMKKPIFVTFTRSHTAASVTAH